MPTDAVAPPRQLPPETKRPNVYIGSPVPRVEDFRFVTGSGQYVADLQRPGQWWAVVVRSPVAHGRIRAIDASQALAMKGVHAVVTARDIGDIPKIHLRSAVPSYGPFAQPVIAAERVRYVGEPVALVLADSAALAEDAAEAVSLDIDPLAVVMDWRQALDDVAPPIEGTSGHVAGSYIASRGDADAAFLAAPYKRRERFHVHRHTAMPMETRGLLAEWDAASGHLTVHGAAKAPHFNRKSLAGLLGLPESAVDYIECDVGGGFGARGEVYPEDFLVAFAARRYGRPVKWLEDRREHFQAMNHARDIDGDIELACARDGTLIALRGTAYVDLGAFARPSAMTTVRNVSLFMSSGYRIPHSRVTGTAVVSNKTPSGVYRGPGRYESCFFLERLIDMAAQDLGLDRLDIRRRNLLRAAEMPYRLASLEPNETGDGFFDSGDYPTALDACAAEFDWPAKSELNGRLIDGHYHGIGAACFVEGGAVGPRENARIALGADGLFTVSVGSSAIGQGLETVLSQIAADALEVPMDRIRILHGSTTLLAEGFGSFASRSTVMGGGAIMVAATNFLEKFRALAAARLQTAPENLRLTEGLAVTADGRSLSLQDVATDGLAADGSFANNKQTYTYGTAMAHVAIDPQTGRVRLLQYQIVDDVGRAINPKTLHGQVIGAAVQGLGGVFSEELSYDAEGQLLVGSFADYLTPVAGDYPDIRAKTMELYPSPNNPLGAKGAGEGGIIPVAGAVSNAVAAALAPLGIEIRDLPLNATKVWALIRQKREIAT